MATKSHITRRNLVLLFLGTSGDPSDTSGSINGITRFQKLLFLLEREGQLVPEGDGFQFEAWKAGPYSAGLYDDLELLDNLGFIQSEVSGKITDAEAAEVDLLDFEDLMGDEEEDSDGITPSPDAYEERRFTLTEKGREKVVDLLSREGIDELVDRIRRIKSKYSHYSLSDLLYHVYTKYPDMTTESEIKEKVLGRRRVM
jgi:uncharacterized protein YwgA